MYVMEFLPTSKDTATNSGIFTMTAVMNSKTRIRAFKQTSFVSRATNVIQDNSSGPLSKSSRWDSFNSVYKTERSADHVSIVCIPRIITDCSPLSVVADLDSTLRRRCASNKTYFTILYMCYKKILEMYISISMMLWIRVINFVRLTWTYIIMLFVGSL